MKSDLSIYGSKLRLVRFLATAISLALGIPFLYSLILTAADSDIPSQPIRFNHRLHVEEVEEPCSTCHTYYEKREVAGRPGVAICGDCHDGALTDSPEEEKLLGYVEKGIELPWLRVTRIPSHVRFSHQRHTGSARIDCETCHGAIARATEPPEEPMILIDMNFCIDCHRARRYRLTARAARALKAQEEGRHLFEDIALIQDRRFDSEQALLAAIERIKPEGLTESDRAILLEHVDASQSVTVDCIACHR